MVTKAKKIEVEIIGSEMCLETCGILREELRNQQSIHPASKSLNIWYWEQ
jgi:hypothetical protein